MCIVDDDGIACAVVTALPVGIYECGVNVSNPNGVGVLYGLQLSYAMGVKLTSQASRCLEPATPCRQLRAFFFQSWCINNHHHVR